MVAPLAAAPTRWLAGMPYRVLLSAAACGGRVAVCELVLPPGGGTGRHRHAGEDEVVHVCSGAVEVRLGREERCLVAGESALLRRGLPHALHNLGADEARLLVVLLPGGLETALTATTTVTPDVAADPDDVAALLAGAGVTLLPPVGAERSTATSGSSRT